jgi:hypothetical protein
VAHAAFLQLAKTDAVVLSFSRVKTITGLSTLRSLVKLRLDNNEIGMMLSCAPGSSEAQYRVSFCCAEQITGLSELANLRELDLSMNRIKKISGLNGLRQLTDLTLFCNQITTIEGLDDQKACLEVLSIGRNQISEQSSIVYLRSFTALRIACLEHNPISQVRITTVATPLVLRTNCHFLLGTLQEGSEYRGSTIALLPHLRYLDWVAVTSGDRRQAAEAFHRLITDADDTQASFFTAPSFPRSHTRSSY